MDFLSKWPEAFALPDMKAETVARIFIERTVCQYGALKVLLSDWGANFLSAIVIEITNLCNIQKISTTAYHPQMNGMVEHFNLMIYTMYVSGHHRDWDKFIPYVLFVYRTSKHKSTGETPFFIMYGR